MAAPSTGRSVGRLSIRVLPDTRKFHIELRNALLKEERRTHFTVNVDRANLDKTKIRADIRRQMEGLDEVSMNINAKVTVDRATLKKRLVRNDIQRQLNEMRGIRVSIDGDLGNVVSFRDSLQEAVDDAVGDLDADVKFEPTLDEVSLNRLRQHIDRMMKDIDFEVDAHVDPAGLRAGLAELHSELEEISHRLAHDILSTEDEELLKHRIKSIADEIDDATKDRSVDVHLNTHTALASRMLAFVTRSRFVDVIVKVNKAAMAKAMTTLAALSGARLSWKFIDDLANFAKDLDKNLPKIAGWTSGLTSLFGAIAASGAGLAGLGGDLMAILPAALVIPGLFINAIGSIAAVVVALKDMKEELAPLKDDFNELGEMISDTFWNEARDPILDLVNDLMPQLHTSFRDLAQGMGEFTAAMSEAFGKELANGRLASIFKDIAEGWRVLGSGADGFAGALVSLSQIAAQYTPRLAHWFVRQADTFDAWLKAISTDGRLDSWMEGAIDAMYDLWDATTGLAGVFEGIFWAADAAGAGGLEGFAEMMQTWEDVVKSADFQKGLTAIFRGADDAMGSFGEAVKGIGTLVADLDGHFENFIASAGEALGGLIEGIADALNNPIVGEGMDGLADGLVEAMRGINDTLPRIGETFGRFLDFLGELLGTLLPTAFEVLQAVMPAIESLMKAIEPALEPLGNAVVQIADALAPAIADFVDAAGPILVDAFVSVANALADIAPIIGELIEALASFVEAAGVWAENNKVFFDQIKEKLGIDVDADDALNDLQNIIGRDAVDGSKYAMLGLYPDLKMLMGDMGRDGQAIAEIFMERYQQVIDEKGPEAAQALVDGFRSIDGLPPEVVNAIESSIAEIDAGRLVKFDNMDEMVVEAISGISDVFDKQGQESGSAYARSLLMSLRQAGVSQDILDEIQNGLKDEGIEIDVSPSHGGGGKFGKTLKAELKAAGVKINADDVIKIENIKSWIDQDNLLAGVQEASDLVSEALAKGGESYAQDMFEALRVSGVPDGVLDAVKADLEAQYPELSLIGSTGGGEFITGMNMGLNDGKDSVAGTGAAVAAAVFSTSSTDPALLHGGDIMLAFTDGITAGTPGSTAAALFAGQEAQAQFDGAEGWISVEGKGMMAGFQGGLRAGTPDMVRQARSAASDAKREFASAGEWLPSRGRSLMAGFRNGIRDGQPGVRSSAAASRLTVQGAVSGSGSWLTAAGLRAARGFQSGIRSGQGAVKAAANGLRDAAVSGAQGGSMYGVGLNLSGGMAAGVRDGGWGVESAARGVAQRAVSAARAALNINSPSRVMRDQVGVHISSGIAAGITKGAPGIEKAMRSAVDLAGVYGPDGSLTVGVAGARGGVGGPQVVYNDNSVINNPRAEPRSTELRRKSQRAAAGTGALV